MKFLKKSLFLLSAQIVGFLAYAGDFDIPSVMSESHDISSVKGFAKKSFAFDPLLSVNPGRGSFGKIYKM